MPSTRKPPGDYGFVVVASRLPVDRVDSPDGETEWRPSPGGRVTALKPVRRDAHGAWGGWPGSAGPAPEPFDTDGMHLVSVGLSEEDAYLGPGLADEITTALARFRWMFVVSSSVIALTALTNRFGSQETAAFSAAAQLWNYVQMPALAISAAASCAFSASLLSIMEKTKRSPRTVVA